MRPVLALSTAALLLAGAAGYAQNDPQVAEAIKQELIKNTRVTATPIQDPGLAACFAAVFYKVTIQRDEGGGATSTSRRVYMKTAKGLEEASKPGTNEAVPTLLAAINPRFVLNNDAAGTAMLNALKSVYTDEHSFGREFDPKVVHDGGTWNFIFGEFMRKTYSGFVMKTDAQGRITEVAYSLEIPK